MCATALSLKGRALQLLGRREHSRTELERKLARFEEEPGALAKALDELQDKGFISEQRVLESVLHRRASRLGTARIQQELHGKGLAPDAVREAVASLQATELERAREVWHKKFGTPAADPAARVRQQRFLLARGFRADVVRRVVGASDDN